MDCFANKVNHHLLEMARNCMGFFWGRPKANGTVTQTLKIGVLLIWKWCIEFKSDKDKLNQNFYAAQMLGLVQWEDAK